MKFWLFKTEPSTYSIADLQKEKMTRWEGVRNYQARNFMTQEMQVGDWVLIYHSNAEPPGVAGLAQVSQKATPDKTQFNETSEYFDPSSTKSQPRWMCVEVAFKEKFKNFLSLEEIRNHKSLQEMLVIKKGQRLSIQPVTESEFRCILELTKSSTSI